MKKQRSEMWKRWKTYIKVSFSVCVCVCVHRKNMAGAREKWTRPTGSVFTNESWANKCRSADGGL